MYVDYVKEKINTLSIDKTTQTVIGDERTRLIWKKWERG